MVGSQVYLVIYQSMGVEIEQVRKLIHGDVTQVESRKQGYQEANTKRQTCCVRDEKQRDMVAVSYN